MQTKSGAKVRLIWLDPVEKRAGVFSFDRVGSFETISFNEIESVVEDDSPFAPLETLSHTEIIQRLERKAKKPTRTLIDLDKKPEGKTIKQNLKTALALLSPEDLQKLETLLGG